MELKSVQHKYLETKSNCTDESYYECISRLFLENLDVSSKKCSPYSLPNLPFCENDERNLKMLDNITTEVIKKDLCPKSCSISEYFVEESLTQETINNIENNLTYLAGYNISQGFSYTFHTSHKTTVNEEYLIYDSISMIGSVGGTLGMCIGFSFTNVVTSILNFIKKGCSGLRKNFG